MRFGVCLLVALTLATVVAPLSPAFGRAVGYDRGDDSAAQRVPFAQRVRGHPAASADTVRVASPKPGSRLSGVATIRVTVSPRPRRVSFWVDGALRGRDRTAPWTFRWHTSRYGDGKHVLGLRAVYDGRVTTRRVKYLVDNKPPGVVLAAGDIGDCTTPGDEQTASILDNEAGTILALGDVVYPNGTDADFANCFAPSWGRHKARIRPAPGNHEYNTRDAAGYFNYFGALAGERGKGWYSFDVGVWHVVALNSNGAIDPGSPQFAWLKSDLDASRATCTLAYWHHPRFSSGVHGSDARFEPWWEVLYANGVDVVLNGHDHDYERFAKQTPSGGRNDARGIRQFVVGTGGSHLRPFRFNVANSEARQDDTWGVLRLVLRSAGYGWRFLPVAGGTYADAGSDTCSR